MHHSDVRYHNINFNGGKMIRIRKCMIVVMSVLSMSFAQTREFPLSKTDYPAYFQLLGTSKVLMSVNTILEKVNATYGEQKSSQYVQQAVYLCSQHKSIDPDSDMITGVTVFTDRYGLLQVTVSINDGSNFTVTLNELVRQKHQLSTQE